MAVIDQFNFEGADAIRVGRFNWGINTTFIVYYIDGTLFDTGPTNQWREVRDFLGKRQVDQILLTHHHEDHAGNAAAVERATGIKPLAPPLALDKLRRGFKTPLLQRIIWGSLEPVNAAPLSKSTALQLGSGEPVTALHLPGHSKDMHCYLMPQRGWLLSADLYLANYLKMLRSDEHLPTLVRSLEQVLTHSFDTLLCPHRGIVKDGHNRLREKHAYLVNLAAEVQALHGKGYPLKVITHQLLGRETAIAHLTGYNFSKQNLIRSCLRVEL